MELKRQPKKCSAFVDKAHAVGMIACLEDHFSRVSSLLDSCGVPREKDGEPLIVEQRVQCLVIAYCSVCGDFDNDGHPAYAGSVAKTGLKEAVKHVEKPSAGWDPEVLHGLICDEAYCEGCHEELVGERTKELEATVERLSSAAEDCNVLVNKLFAERDKYKAALERIANEGGSPDNPRRARRIDDIARAALGMRVLN